MTDPKTVTVQERLRAGPVWGDGSPIGSVVGAINGATMNEAADLLDRCQEALEGLMAHAPDYADTLWLDAREVLTQLNGGRNVG